VSDLRLAVVQTEVSGEVPSRDVVAAAGARVREALVAAAAAGARVVQFAEGTLAYPSKRLMSVTAPEVGPAEWSRADWGALRHELELVAKTCAELRVWAVVGAPHPLSGDRRPHNSLYVFDDTGAVHTRYDKRRLSTNETGLLYAPGTEPVVFDVDGIRFGMVLCLEILFPELFVEYAAMDVDCVLVSSAPDPKFESLVAAHALMNAITVSIAFAAGSAEEPHRSGICTLFGWSAQCDSAEAGFAIGDIPKLPATPGFHRQARNGLYDPWLVGDDVRSSDRQTL
jgi:predicted amidohydrolase